MTNIKDKGKERKYKCETCKKRFLSKNDLRKHTRIHTGEKPFKCNECLQSFRQAVSLKNHIISKHQQELNSPEIFICFHCDKPFSIKERLRLHLRIHTGVKPYACTRCPKRFSRGGQLSQHMRTHTGVRPYVCKICESAFTCAANLKLHVKRHMDVRDYVCDICGKSFFRRDALQKHLKCYHANVKAFHCKICNRDFKGHLPQHVRTHRNDKPHGCAHCGARFAQRSQLTVHQRVHSGEKPYRCQVCWKAFSHSTALKLHTRQHTGEKPFKCILCVNSAFSQLPHLKKHMLCIHKSSKPYVCPHCRNFYKSKREMEAHNGVCKAPKIEEEDPLPDLLEPPMPLDKMRFLLAVLLKKISTRDKLKDLGFNKKLIDDVLIASIKSSQHEPCTDMGLAPAIRLKKNLEILLEWTVPKQYMEKFRNEQRSTEELLEELTS